MPFGWWKGCLVPVLAGELLTDENGPSLQERPLSICCKIRRAALGTLRTERLADPGALTPPCAGLPAHRSAGPGTALHGLQLLRVWELPLSASTLPSYMRKHGPGSLVWTLRDSSGTMKWHWSHTYICACTCVYVLAVFSISAVMLLLFIFAI